MDEVVGQLSVRWPGVRYHCVLDAAQAAEHVINLTRALAEQPFKVQVKLVLI